MKPIDEVLTEEHLKALFDIQPQWQPPFAIGIKLNEKKINVVGFVCDIKARLIDETGNPYYRVSLKGCEIGLRIYTSEYLKDKE